MSDPFAAPTDDWLCWIMDNFNLVQGYPSRSSETGCFVKPVKSQTNWYGLHPNQDRPARSVSFWHCDSAKLNSSYIIIIIMYLYSVQYLHILQDSKRYLTNPTVQVQPQLTSN